MGTPFAWPERPAYQPSPTGRESATDACEAVENLYALFDRPAWHRDALCKEFPELPWYPERGQSTVETKAVCARCLVREECLAAAMSNFDDRMFGIWGGTSGRERRRRRVVSSDGAPARYPPSTERG